MARSNKSPAENTGVVNGELPKPDFERAIRVMSNDLNPLTERGAKLRGEQSAGWKVIENDCHCNKKAAKVFHNLMRMDQELRDDWFRTFRGLLEAGGIGITPDMVDMAEGDDASPIIPIVEAGRPQLATMQ